MTTPLMKLVFPTGDHPPRLLEPGTYRIGSAPDADLRLAGDEVAAEHCALVVAAQGVQLRIAPGSRVEVNERPVAGVIALRPNDLVGIAGTRMRLLEPAAPAAPGPRAPAATERDVMSTTVRPVLPRFVLKGVSGDLLGRSVPLHATVTVGRSGECDLRIDAESISRMHARLTPAEDAVLVEDLGSANGTWINGNRVLREHARHGDEVRFDAHRFQLLLPGQPLPPARAHSGGEDARPARGAWAAGLALAALLGLTAYFLLG